MNLPKEEFFERFTFDYSNYSYGFQKTIRVFSVYISGAVIVPQYYDKERKVWSKRDVHMIYQEP